MPVSDSNGGRAKRLTASETVFIVGGVISVLLVLVYFSTPSNPPPATSPSARLTLRDAPRNNCDASNFITSKPDAKIIRGRVHFTAVIRHNCSHAAGVGFKWTTFNADGGVAFSKNIWPSRVNNIPPNTDYPFEMIEAAPQGKWTFEVTPINAR